MRFNFLLDEFPTKVVVKEREYEIDSSFKTILNIIRISEDFLFSENEKVAINLELFYKGVLPSNLTEAYGEMMNFIGMYDEGKLKKKDKVKSFDYQIDADKIHAAFYQQYKIDLLDDTMHWFRFVKLLTNLSGDTPALINAIQIRTMKVDDKMSATEKARIRKLKKEYSLNDNEDENISFAEAFLGMSGKKDRKVGDKNE